MMQNPIAVFGEVLFDHFPDGSRVLGGAPFNVAWHLQAFGGQPLFISRVGRDEAGNDVQRAMRAWGMSDKALQRDERHPTGAVAISLLEGEPHYQILPEQAYDFVAATGLPPVTDYSLLYHGTLALRHTESRHALAELKHRHRGPVFLDVNLRAPWWRASEVELWLAEADWVKLNGDELDCLQPGRGPLAQRMDEFRQRFDLQGLVVTLGERGGVALLADGEKAIAEPENQVAVVDCVGAGDAFAAVLILGIVEGWPLPLTMRRAQDFASALVGRRGATVDEQAFYRPFVEAWDL